MTVFMRCLGGEIPCLKSIPGLESDLLVKTRWLAVSEDWIYSPETV